MIVDRASGLAALAHISFTPESRTTVVSPSADGALPVR